MEDTKVADIFAEDINNLTEHLNIVITAHNKQLDKIEQLTNNWNELEEYINKEKYQDTWGDSVILVGYLLDKMKEIKEGNNEHR